MTALDTFVSAKLAEEESYRVLVARRNELAAATAAAALAQTNYETAQRASTAAYEAYLLSAVSGADSEVAGQRPTPTPPRDE